MKTVQTTIVPNSALYSNAQNAHTSGNISKAETICRQILNTNAKDSIALHGLGLIALGQNHHKAGLELISKAAEVDKTDDLIALNLGIAYSLNGMQEKAGEAFQRAIALEPNNLDARFNCGTHFLEMKEFENAISEFRKIIKKQPNNYYCLINLGISYVEIGQYSQKEAFVKDLSIRAVGNRYR